MPHTFQTSANIGTRLTCVFLRSYTSSHHFILSLNMAGPSNSIPISDSFDTSFLEALFYGNQSNVWGDLSEDFPFSYSSLLSNNPLETNAPSASMLPAPPSSLGLDIAPPSPRVQESAPVATNPGTCEAGPSKRPVKRCRNMAELMETTRSSPSRDPTPNLAETANPFSCGCCHVLREIIHTNGLQYHKLEVHGMIGMICHAVFHQDVQGGSNRPQMFDFGKKNMEEIKHFLVSYCFNQESLGYVLVSDPLSAYYEALCVGLEWTRNQNEPRGSPFQINAENVSNKGKEPAVVDNLPNNYSALKLSETYRARLEQRQRVEAMSVEDFKGIFHLTLEEASKLINVSKNSIRGICHRGGVKDWPHKKLQNLMKRVRVLRAAMSQQDPISRTTSQNEIDRLRDEMIQVCGGVVPDIALTI